MNRINKWAFSLLFLMAFATILYKVFYVPITHDESSTFVQYAKRGVWTIMMYPDSMPNNHIINSLSIKFFTQIFGEGQWVLRLASLLSFFLFVFGVYRLIGLLFKKDSVLIIAGLSLFITNAYFLDFFSLARGYAMASALAVLSTSHLLSGYMKGKDKHVFAAFFLAILSSYANFTLLIFWVSISILAALYFIHAYWENLKLMFKKIGILALATMAYIALIFEPLRKMTASNEFSIWSEGGFYEDTIRSLAGNWRWGSSLLFGFTKESISMAVVIVIIASALIIIWKFWKKGFTWGVFSQALPLSFTILILTVFVNVSQNWLLNTPNLSGRIALFFYPLFSLLLLSLLAELSKIKINWPKYVIAIGIPILAFWHFNDTFYPNSVKEWKYDESTLDILSFLDETAQKEAITLKTHWVFHPSFTFYTRTGKAPFLQLYPYDKDIDLNTNATYYYVLGADVEKLTPKFEKIKEFGNNRWLMKRIDVK